MISTVNSSPTMTGLFNIKSKVKYPQIYPRNVYLRAGRVIKPKETQRFIENFGEPFWVRAKNWFKYKIEDWLDK